MARIFLSHASVENFEALALKDWLVSEGWAAEDVFLDLHGIGAGERWKEALAKANERCEAVVLLASPASLASTECRLEIRMAEDYGKEIVVAILHLLAIDAKALDLYRERQIVDLSLEPREAAFTITHQGQTRSISFNRPTLARIKARLDQLGIAPTRFPWRPGDLDHASPYPGMRGFDVAEAAVFFGRASDMARGLAEIRRLKRTGTSAILVIQAASGAGKSSFLRAGLWPRLGRDPEFVPLAILRPATGILTGETGVGRQFAAHFAAHDPIRARTLSPAAIHQRLRGSEAEALAALIELINAATESAHDALRLVRDDAATPTPIIAIDQAEELFATEDAAESERFLRLLAQLFAPEADHSPKLIAQPMMLWTMRADSMDQLLHATRAAGLKPPALFPLPPIGRDAYREIIETPLAVANQAGMKLAIDPLLTEALVTESQGADAPPLLAFTLRQLLAESRMGARASLTLETYEGLGRMGGILTKRLGEAQRAAQASDADVRRLFLPQLATWDAEATPPGAKRLVADEAILFAGDRAGLKALADRLVEERLLTRAGGAITLEVAHEALLRQPPLSNWLEEDREFLVWRGGLARARAGFEANQRGLLIGRELELARGWVEARPESDIPAADRAFIAESLTTEAALRAAEAERERQLQAAELAAAREREAAAAEMAQAADKVARSAKKTAQRTLAGLLAALLLAAVAGGAGWWAWQQQQIATAEAERAEQAATLARTEAQRAEAETERARASERTAAETTREAQITQSGLLSETAKEVVKLPGDSGAPLAMLLALEGTPDAKSDDLRQALRPHDAETEFQLDGAHRINRERAVIAHDDDVWAVAWSPDDTRVATGSSDKTARIWDAASGKELARLTHDDDVRSVAWSPDGTKLATASRDRTARIWDAASGKELARVTHDDDVNAVAWNPLPPGADGSTLIASASDKTVRIWRVFTTPQALVDAAKARAARCVTPEERAQYFLPPAPPTWCVERRLWPYHTDEWQAWLPKQKAWLAANRQGEAPALPPTQ